MQINGSYNSWDLYRFGFGYINKILKHRSVTSSPNPLPVSKDRDQSVHAMRNAIRMRKALEEIRSIMLEHQEIKVVSPASATSTTDLGLDTNETAATMQSTEEVNATPTSFSPFGPEWNGGSSAQVTISGEYDGSNGSDTLTFKVTEAGTHGEDRLKIKVFDSSDQKIDQIDIKPEHSLDKQYTLDNGLVLTLGEGDLSRKDTFTVDVFDSVGSAVDPDKTFNGIRNDNPNLEYGLSVTSGSFQVNGIDINVSNEDTINTVLEQINQSDAGVTATFDAETERVLLTQKTTGSSHDIVLENDTSGFLAAVKLDGAMSTSGEDPETEKPMAEVERFASVQSGVISVNGVAIAIDVNTESLTDILSRISGSGAEVSASYNSNSQRVSINSDNINNQLTIEGGTTNFFAALEIMEGTYNSVNDLIHADGVSMAEVSNLLVEADSTNSSDQALTTNSARGPDAKMIGTLVKIIAESMNALFENSEFGLSPTAMLEQARDEIRDAVAEAFGSDSPSFETDFGINFDFDNTNKGVFNFSQDDQGQLESALTTPEGMTAIRNMLFEGEADGLLSRMHATLTAVESGLKNEIGSTGLFLNIMA